MFLCALPRYFSLCCEGRIQTRAKWREFHFQDRRHAFAGSFSLAFGLSMLLSTVPVAAQSADNAMKSLRRVYGAVILFNQYHAACNQAVPQNAAIHKRAYDAFAAKHALPRISAFFAMRPNPMPKISGVEAQMAKFAPVIMKQIQAQPQTCSSLGGLFEGLVTRKLGPVGIVNLGNYFDKLLRQANIDGRAATVPPGTAAHRTAPARKSTVTGGKKGKIETLSDIHRVTLIVPRLQQICDDVAPNQAARHRTAIEAFAQRHALERIRAHFAASRERYPWIDANVKEFDASMDKLRKSFQKNPRACSVLPAVLAKLVEKNGGISNLGEFFDRLSATTGASALIPKKSSAQDAGHKSNAQRNPVQTGRKTSTLRTTDNLPMPTAIGRKVKTLPGLSWKRPNNVRPQSGRCVWRCVSMAAKGKVRYPWLIIHEAVPLPADQAIGAILSSLKKNMEVTDKQLLPSDRFAANMALKPDRTMIMNVSLNDRKSRRVKKRRRVLFAFEKDGVTAVAEWYYLRQPSREARQKNEVLLGTIIRSIRMDTAAVKASLRAPIPITIGMADGAPPAPNQVIYADTPQFRLNSLTVSGRFGRDVRYLDASAVKKKGKVIKIDGSGPFYYVPRLANGTTIRAYSRNPAAISATQYLSLAERLSRSTRTAATPRHRAKASAPGFCSALAVRAKARAATTFPAIHSR